jgi:hypothetical protein
MMSGTLGPGECGEQQGPSGRFGILWSGENSKWASIHKWRPFARGFSHHLMEARGAGQGPLAFPYPVPGARTMEKTLLLQALNGSEKVLFSGPRSFRVCCFSAFPWPEAAFPGRSFKKAIQLDFHT